MLQSHEFALRPTGAREAIPVWHLLVGELLVATAYGARPARGRSGWYVMLVRALRLVRSGSNQHVKQICLKTQSFNQHVKRICQTNAKFEPTCQTNVKQMPTTNCLCLQKGIFSFGIFSIGDIQSWDVQLESMQYHAR